MAVRRLRASAISLFLRSTPRCAAQDNPPLVSLHRLLCSAAAASSVSSPAPFVAEDYLVSRCGLTPAQALKGAKKITHLGSRANPDAVLAFLGGTLGVPAADITAAVAADASILCSNVERTLAARISDLSDLGLSLDQIARLFPHSPNAFRNRSLSRNLEFWIKEMGSFDKLLQVVALNTAILNTDLNKVAKPNITLLQQCGLNASDIAFVSLHSSRLLTTNPNLLREAVERVEELGVERGSRMFRRALGFLAVRTKEAVAAIIQVLQKFGFSQDDVREIVRKAPTILGLSDQKVQGNLDFLMKVIGLDVSYIVRRPVLLLYSVERRLLPRNWLLKVLKEKELLIVKLDYYVTASMGEKFFVERFVLPYKDVISGLADDYASKCSGKVVDRVS